MFRPTIRPLILLLLASCALDEETPDLREGRIMAPTGPLDITYEVKDGVYVYEGDIVISPDDLIDPDVAYSGTVTHDKTWPNGVVPYVIDGGLPNAQRVSDAIGHWHSTTIIRFVPRTTEGAYVRFKRHSDADTCNSSLGRQGGAQDVNLGDNCSTGNTKHEIGHAVGLLHEHTRADRDSFINVHWTNIPVTDWHNYYKRGSGHDVGAYDFNSIMHYSSGPAAAPRITRKDGTTFGSQRDALSDRDRLGVEFLYGAMTNAGRYSALDKDGKLTMYPRTPDLSAWRTNEASPGGSWSSAWTPLTNSTLFQSQPVVGRNADGRHELFGTTLNARLVHGVPTLSGATSWFLFDSSRQFLDAPAVARDRDGRLVVFATGADRQLYQMFQLTVGDSNSWTPPLSLGGWLQTTPGVGRTGDGRLIVLGRAADNTLWFRLQDTAGSWGAWTQLSTVKFAGVPAVGTNLDGSIVVAARNATTGYITMYTRLTSGAWTPATTLTSLVTKGNPAFGRNLDGRLELAVIGSDSSTYHAWQTAPNSSWSGYAGYGGYTISQTPELARLRDGRLQVVVRGGDDMLYRSVQTQANGAWGGWQVMPGHTAYTD